MFVFVLKECVFVRNREVDSEPSFVFSPAFVHDHVEN